MRGQVDLSFLDGLAVGSDDSPLNRRSRFQTEVEGRVDGAGADRTFTHRGAISRGLDPHPVGDIGANGFKSAGLSTMVDAAGKTSSGVIVVGVQKSVIRSQALDSSGVGSKPKKEHLRQPIQILGLDKPILDQPDQRAVPIDAL